MIKNNKKIIFIYLITFSFFLWAVDDGRQDFYGDPQGSVPHSMAGYPDANEAEPTPTDTPKPAVGQDRFGALRHHEMTLGKWIGLEMLTTAERQGLDLKGEHGLGVAMQGHPVRKHYENLVPYAPFGPIRVEGLQAFLESMPRQAKKRIPDALAQLLAPLGVDQAYQILMYPTVWKPDTEFVPMVAARAHRMTDGVVDLKTFLAAFNEQFLGQLDSIFKLLSAKKQILPLPKRFYPRMLGYLGQLLIYESRLAVHLTQRIPTIRLLLERDPHTDYSQYMLARSYKDIKLFEDAAKILRALWQKGSAIAALDYAILDREEGAPRFHDRLKAFEFAAHRGLPEAQFHWAQEMMKMAPFPDHESIRVFLTRAAAQGFGRAMMALGHDYAEGTYGGKVDLAKAQALFEEAGDEGVVMGYKEAAELSYNLGTDQGYRKARDLYEQALSLAPTDRDAANKLAILWAKGWGGDQNLDKALAYIVPLANNEATPESRACHNVGAILLLKKDARSNAEARRYFKKSADLQDKHGAYQYAVLCRDGIGGKVNMSQAFKYAEIARKLGHEKAHALIKGMRQEVPPAKWPGEAETHPLLY